MPINLSSISELCLVCIHQPHLPILQLVMIMRLVKSWPLLYKLIQKVKITRKKKRGGQGKLVILKHTINTYYYSEINPCRHSLRFSVQRFPIKFFSWYFNLLVNISLHFVWHIIKYSPQVMCSLRLKKKKKNLQCLSFNIGTSTKRA